MSDNDPGLNENHLRRLMTSLHLLQSAADRLEILLQPGAAASSHEIILDTVAPALKDLVYLRLQQLHGRIADTLDAYHLPRRTRDLHRILSAEISSMWVNLEDLRPHRMLGRGPIAPPAAEQLDTRIQAMLTLVDELRVRLASGGRGDDEAG